MPRRPTVAVQLDMKCQLLVSLQTGDRIHTNQVRRPAELKVLTGFEANQLAGAQTQQFHALGERIDAQDTGADHLWWQHEDIVAVRQLDKTIRIGHDLTRQHSRLVLPIGAPRHFNRGMVRKDQRASA